ncbi:MAG TPA: TatD family hydrolase [Epulopiscium sp.]|nr:TatD family hydrolase [Candidatus Epulonipiscium sp.]
MFFDSHAHYDDNRFNEDRDELLSSMKKNKVDYIVNAAADIVSSNEGIQLAEQYSFIYAGVGVHPHSVAELDETDQGKTTLELLEQLTKHPKVVAIGEIGLDYYYEHSPKEVQRIWFRRQMELAKKVDLPIIVHSREASQETFDMIRESGMSKGVIHCFSGSAQMAQEYIQLGFYIGVGGTITFNNARKSVEVVEQIPLESIVIETDCPYLTPMPYRGKRNDSTYLAHIAQKIADIKNVSIEEVARMTSKNAKELFAIKR